jgi:hypothetical protein
MQREDALQSLCQLVNELLTLQIAQIYQAIVGISASGAAGAPQALQRRI